MLTPADKNQTLATIHVAATVFDVPNVDDVVGFTQFNLGLTLTWIDARLSYVNLVQNTFLNRLSTSEMQLIWNPILRYLNKAPNHRELEEVVVPTISIIANSSYMSPTSELYTYYVFPGISNILQWTEQIRCIVISYFKRAPSILYLSSSLVTTANFLY